MKQAVNVAITGAAGQIGYALAFRVASGQMFGPDQPVILNLVDIEPALPVLQGVMMELDDCASPLLKGITATANLNEPFGNATYNSLQSTIRKRLSKGLYIQMAFTYSKVISETDLAIPQY